MTSRYWSWSQGSRPRPRSRLASNVRLRITALCPVFAFCCLSVGTAGILCQTKLSCSCVFSLHVVVSQCVCVWKDVCCSMHTQQYSTFLINVLQLAHVYTCRAPFYVFLWVHTECVLLCKCHGWNVEVALVWRPSIDQGLRLEIFCKVLITVLVGCRAAATVQWRAVSAADPSDRWLPTHWLVELQFPMWLWWWC